MIELRDDVITMLALDKQTLEAYEYQGEKEVWAMGHHKLGLTYATKIFEAHEPEYILQRQAPTKRHKWYSNVIEYSHRMPVVTLHDWSGAWHFKGFQYVPNVKLNVMGQPFIESSIGYMLASCLSLMMQGIANVKKIRLYGVSFNNTPDYAYQRPNSMYYVGRLEQAGVEFEYPSKGCKIFDSAWKTGLYGMTDNLSN